MDSASEKVALWQISTGVRSRRTNGLEVERVYARLAAASSTRAHVKRRGRWQPVGGEFQFLDEEARFGGLAPEWGLVYGCRP